MIHGLILSNCHLHIASVHLLAKEGSGYILSQCQILSLPPVIDARDMTCAYTYTQYTEPEHPKVDCVLTHFSKKLAFLTKSSWFQETLSHFGYKISFITASTSKHRGSRCPFPTLAQCVCYCACVCACVQQHLNVWTGTSFTPTLPFKKGKKWRSDLQFDMEVWPSEYGLSDWG